jgi:peptidoglycan/xylan/chitin deacetylase (PgdA/CDA1 family)
MHGDWFDARPRELLLRRMLIALRVPPALLAALGRTMPGAARRRRWTAFAGRVAQWHERRRESTRDEWTRVTRGIPVLVYHAFGDEPSRFVVSRRAFARQMRLLSLLRCHVVTFGELAGAIASRRLLPPRTVVLTIDDGYVESRDVATDAIAQHGYATTIFVVTGRLGGVNDWAEAEPLRGRRLLSQDDIVELRKRGIEFGAHTRSHADLDDLDDLALAEEIASAGTGLEEVLGEPVRMFAYPYGHFDERIVGVVRTAGFEGACTVAPRPACLDDDPLRLPRIEINRSDSLLRFLVKVVFAWA